MVEAAVVSDSQDARDATWDALMHEAAPAANLPSRPEQCGVYYFDFAGRKAFLSRMLAAERHDCLYCFSFRVLGTDGNSSPSSDSHFRFAPSLTWYGHLGCNSRAE